MRRINIPKLRFIVSGLAIALIGAQITLSESTSGGTYSYASNGAQAQMLSASAVRSTPPAQPASLPTPGEVRKGPNGQLVPVPTFVPDDFRGPTMPAMGIPAIQPSITSAEPDSPAFTMNDVSRYRSSLGMDNVGEYHSSIPVQMVKAEFLTQSELLKRSEYLNVGASPDTLLCFVQYSGSFALKPPPGSKGSSVSIPDAPYSQLVFNAHTGNLLMSAVDNTLR